MSDIIDEYGENLRFKNLSFLKLLLAREQAGWVIFDAKRFFLQIIINFYSLLTLKIWTASCAPSCWQTIERHSRTVNRVFRDHRMKGRFLEILQAFAPDPHCWSESVPNSWRLAPPLQKYIGCAGELRISKTWSPAGKPTAFFRVAD